MLPAEIEDSARSHARYFSAAGLRELQRLQTRPVMARFQTAAPQMLAELSRAGFQTRIKRQPELQRGPGPGGGGLGQPATAGAAAQLIFWPFRRDSGGILHYKQPECVRGRFRLRF